MSQNPGRSPQMQQKQQSQQQQGQPSNDPPTKGSALPPSWEQFINFPDPAKRELIYSTMCKQILSQQNQVNTLIKADASLRYKLEEECKRLKQEIEFLRKTDGNEPQRQQSGATDAVNEQIKKLTQEKELIIQQHQSDIDKYEEYIKQLIDEIKQLKNMNNQQPEIISSALKVTSLERENRDLKYSLNEFKNEYEKLSNQFTLQQNENEQNNQKLGGMKNQLEQLSKVETKCRSLQQELNQMQDEFTRVKNTNERLQSELEKQIQEKNNVQVQLQGYHAKIDKMKQMETLETQFQGIYTDFQSIKSQYGVQNSKLKEYEIAIEELVAENSRLILDICNFKTK